MQCLLIKNQITYLGVLGRMKEQRKMMWQVISVIIAMILTTVIMVGDIQSTLNVKSNIKYSFLKNSEENEDALSIAFANVINLDSALKEKQLNVLYIVREIQTKYGEYEKALKTIDMELELSYDMPTMLEKIELVGKIDNDFTQEVVLDQVIDKQARQYQNLGLEEKLNYNYLLILNNQNLEAIENYKEILLWNTDVSYLGTINNNIAWAYLNLNDYVNAKIYCNIALKYDADDSIALSNLGNSYYGLDEIQKAYDTYDKALKIDPENAFGLYGLASAANDLEKYDVARDAWIKYVALKPKDVDGWDGLYDCYLVNQDLDGQNECIENMILLDPTNSRYTYDYLIIQHEMNSFIRPNRLVSAYRKAAGDFKADSLVAYFTYNYLSVDDSLKLYEDLVEKYDLTYNEYLSLAGDVYYLGETPIYESVLNKIEAKLGREDRLEIEANIYYEDEITYKLLEVTKELIEINPKSGYGYEYLGDAYYFKKDYENAEANYDIARHYVENPAYSMMARVDCLILLGATERANHLNLDYIASYPDDEYGYIYQARIEMKKGHEKEAIEQLLIANSISDNLGNVIEYYEELAPLKNNSSLKSFIH